MAEIHHEMISSLNEAIEIVKSNLDYICIKEASRWSNIGWHTPPGVYDDFEIICAISGTRKIAFQDDEFVSQPGDIIWLDSSRQSSGEEGIHTFLCVVFRLNENKSSKKEEYSRLCKCFNNLRFLRLESSGLYAIHHHFEKMCEESVLKQDHSELSMKLFFLQFLIDIQRILAFRLSGERSEYRLHSKMVSDILVFLSDQMDNTLTLDQLGQKYNLNPRYLNSLFKSYTGRPIMKYMHELKMEKAKRLLKAGALRNIDIAVELGFESSQSFNTAFKKAFHITPKAYRISNIK